MGPTVSELKKINRQNNWVLAFSGASVIIALATLVITWVK